MAKKRKRVKKQGTKAASVVRLDSRAAPVVIQAAQLLDQSVSSTASMIVMQWCAIICEGFSAKIYAHAFKIRREAVVERRKLAESVKASKAAEAAALKELAVGG